MNSTTWRIAAALFFLGGAIRAVTAYNAWANEQPWVWNGLLAAALLLGSVFYLFSNRTSK